MKYAFIYQERLQYPLNVLFPVLHVSRSGYYAFLKRAPSVLDSVTLAQVRRLHLASRRTYGQWRMRLALRPEGMCVGRWRTRMLMRQAGVSVKGGASLEAAHHRKCPCFAGCPQPVESAICRFRPDSGVGQ